MINRGVQFTAHPERFGEMSCFHHRRHPTFPGNVSAYNIYHTTCYAFGCRIVRARENFRSADGNVELVAQLTESCEVHIEKRLLEPVIIQFLEFTPHAQSFLV